MTDLPVCIAAATAAFALTFAQLTVLSRPASHDPRAVEVSYGDLDLSDTADAASALHRAREGSAAQS